MFFELFANWFDYCHFFDKELTFYLDCIWESWFAVPFVQKEPNEYIFRSFAVFVMSSVDQFDRAVAQGNELSYLETRWIEFVNLFERDLYSIHCKLDFPAAKPSVMILAECLLPPFSFVAHKFHYPPLRCDISAPYPEMETHISNLSDGHLPPTPIRNPFAVVKECRRRASSWSPERMYRTSAAILISFRNEIAFLDR